MSFTNRHLVQVAAELLKIIGSETAMLDAQLLLAHALKKDRLDIQLQSAYQPNDLELSLFFELLARRLSFEPVAYILEKKEFFGAEFYVSKDCLIPRPDTEVVVEECLKVIRDDSIVFELCTGSGAIAITLLRERPCLRAKASDISEKALALALKNSQSLGVSERLDLLAGDLFEPFKGLALADLIVINPPYIASAGLIKLSPFVRDHEPELALDGGEDGLAFYRRILAQASDYLAKDGHLILEIGYDQAQSLLNLADKWQWSSVIFKDLAGLDRGIVLQKR